MKIEARLTELYYSGNNLKTRFHLLADLKKIPSEFFMAKNHMLLDCYGNAFGESSLEDPEKMFFPASENSWEIIQDQSYCRAVYGVFS